MYSSAHKEYNGNVSQTGMVLDPLSLTLCQQSSEFQEYQDNRHSQLLKTARRERIVLLWDFSALASY